jgi:predicted nucleic acid-binding Zn ribbon protein
MERKRPRTKFVHIGRIIDSVLKTYRRDTDASLVQVCQIWDSVVGDVIAQNARPAAMKGRILLVHVASSTWLHQFMFLKGEILEKLNHALNGEPVEDLKFKIGPLKNGE